MYLYTGSLLGDEVVYRMHTDFVYIIELNNEVYPHMQFESYDAAYEYVMESGMYYEGEWEIIEWPVD